VRATLFDYICWLVLYNEEGWMTSGGGMCEQETWFTRSLPSAPVTSVSTAPSTWGEH